MIIFTERLCLTSSTKEIYEQYLKSPETYPFDDGDWENAKFISIFLELEKKGKITDPIWFYPWIIKNKERSQDFGNISFKGEPVNGEVGFGYSLLSEFRGIGYATEAGRAFIEWGFEQGVTKIEARTLIDNIKSINVLKKLGFRIETKYHEDGKDWYLHTLNR